MGNRWAEISKLLMRTEYWVKKTWRKLLKENGTHCPTKDEVWEILSKLNHIEDQHHPGCYAGHTEKLLYHEFADSPLHFVGDFSVNRRKTSSTLPLNARLEHSSVVSPEGSLKMGPSAGSSEKNGAPYQDFVSNGGHCPSELVMKDPSSWDGLNMEPSISAKL